MDNKPIPLHTLSEMVQDLKARREVYDGPGAYTINDLYAAFDDMCEKTIRNKANRLVELGAWVRVIIPAQSDYGPRTNHAWVKKEIYEQWKGEKKE